VERLRSLGGEPVKIDFAPFLEVARLLYEGPWVAERYAAIRDFFDARPEALFGVTREIIGGGRGPRAVDAFEAQYRLQALRRQAEAVWDSVDLVLTPTAGTIPTIAAVQAEPLQVNSNLGYYTNFMNLLDLCAVAVPSGFRADGLPFGADACSRPRFVTGSCCRSQIGCNALQACLWGRPATHSTNGRRWLAMRRHRISVAVCGAHMSGLPLNHQLTDRRARLLRATRTAPEYRFYALPGGPPERPGLVRVGSGGAVDRRGGLDRAGRPLRVLRRGDSVRRWASVACVWKMGVRYRGFCVRLWRPEVQSRSPACSSWRHYIASGG
jgi:allophanate hydrolase